MASEKEYYKTYPVFLEQVSQDTYIYVFETNAGIEYLVKFTKAPYYFHIDCNCCQNIYEISFSPKNGKSEPDKAIMLTIIELIDLFITRYEAAILYVCESLDNKERFRLKLFEKWFKAGNTNNRFKHRADIFTFEDYELILGILSVSWDENFDTYFNQIDIPTE